MSRRAILLVACFGLFFVQLDVTIVNVALKPIASGLGTGTATLQWVVDGYALALSALILSAGDVADLAGAAPAARWRVPADTGRRYAAVSGDVNPIHLAAPAAREGLDDHHAAATANRDRPLLSSSLCGQG